MNWFEFDKWPVEVQDFKRIIDNFRGIYKIYLKLINKKKLTTCNRLNLESLGFGPIMLKHLPGHWGADHTGQFWHHMSANPAVIVKKMVDHHLFLNIIPNNFTARTERKVWCDWGMNQATRLPQILNLQSTSPLVFIHPTDTYFIQQLHLWPNNLQSGDGRGRLQ